ncbi:hypothetical protein SAMN04488065_0071 [Haloplanus vescus]|uniref:Uncharacterized protein n=1 Tax=Haloplanus vescus TaxID=555874 RepID=A0A1H3VNL5_9EURY|nr:hypothetical protein [Haloplanus vescus]SDZ75682.1 hypothetical protein SAMN04488065_0071 [Haloplanus vescus]
MPFTRRNVLAAAALAQATALSGCFGGGGDTETTPTDSGPTDEQSATGTATATATQSPSATPTATPVADAELAAATTAIVDEYAWFRDDYDSALTQFRVAVGSVYDTLSEIQSASERTEADVTAFREASTDLASFVQSTLQPHFDVDAALRIGDNVYVRDFERAVSRDDQQLQDSVLSRAKSYYQRVRSSGYVANELSRRPVHDSLYDMLVPSGAGDHIVALVGDEFVTWAHPDKTESTSDDGVAQHTHEFPSGYRVYTHAHDHRTGHSLRDHTNEPPLNELYAYGDGDVAILEDAASWRERLDDFQPAFTGLFAPLKSENPATALTLFLGTIGPNFDSTPVYVETFESVDAAQAAVDDDIGTEGTTTLAGQEWERVFYDAADTTIYAYRLRAGSAVVAALPSDVPWERRRDPAADLKGTWLAGE